MRGQAFILNIDICIVKNEVLTPLSVLSALVWPPEMIFLIMVIWSAGMFLRSVAQNTKTPDLMS